MKKRICILAVLVIVGIVAILGVYNLSNSQGRETADNSVAGLVGARTNEISSKDNPSLDTYLDKLAKAENCPIVDGIVDVNKKVSKGKFCFQKSTYLYFVKRYEIYPYAEETELLSNWGDSWTQGEILKRIIEEDKRLLAIHWVNSIKKIGLPQ